jgi:hypothetical protein
MINITGKAIPISLSTIIVAGEKKFVPKMEFFLCSAYNSMGVYNLSVRSSILLHFVNTTSLRSFVLYLSYLVMMCIKSYYPTETMIFVGVMLTYSI